MCRLIIRRYEKDMKLRFKEMYTKRESTLAGFKEKKEGSRSEIKEFSEKSARRLKFKARNIAHKMVATVDLTYPEDFPVDGTIVKNHYSKFRKRLKRMDIKSLWVLEFQKRGAPHLHLLVDKMIDKNKLSKMWFEIVDSGDEKHLKAGTRIKEIEDEDRVVRYLVSYLKKQDQKVVPKGFVNVGRFWGCARRLSENRFFV